MYGALQGKTLQHLRDKITACIVVTLVFDFNEVMLRRCIFVCVCFLCSTYALLSSHAFQDGLAASF